MIYKMADFVRGSRRPMKSIFTAALTEEATRRSLKNNYRRELDYATINSAATPGHTAAATAALLSDSDLNWLLSLSRARRVMAPREPGGAARVLLTPLADIPRFIAAYRAAEQYGALNDDTDQTVDVIMTESIADAMHTLSDTGYRFLTPVDIDISTRGDLLEYAAALLLSDALTTTGVVTRGNIGRFDFLDCDAFKQSIVPIDSGAVKYFEEVY